MQEFKPNYRPLGSEEDDVVDPRSEQADGPFDHERFKTLTVLAHAAGRVMDRYAIKGFDGFTNRQADWACKLQSFFNLSNTFETLVLLLFTFQFSQNERLAILVGSCGFYSTMNPSYPLAVTSARLARMAGAVSGAVSNARAFPGIFAPTNQEFACVRKIFAPSSLTCLTQASSASMVGAMRLKSLSRR